MHAYTHTTCIRLEVIFSLWIGKKNVAHKYFVLDFAHLHKNCLPLLQKNKPKWGQL